MFVFLFCVYVFLLLLLLLFLLIIKIIFPTEALVESIKTNSITPSNLFTQNPKVSINTSYKVLNRSKMYANKKQDKQEFLLVPSIIIILKKSQIFILSKPIFSFK